MKRIIAILILLASSCTNPFQDTKGGGNITPTPHAYNPEPQAHNPGDYPMP